MGPEAWRAMLGEDAWRYLHAHCSDADAISKVLTAAVEVGFLAPQTTPVVDPRGTKVFWPGGPMLTAKGLWEHWKARGHGWVLLRAEELLEAVRGPLLPRLQEILASYEAECDRRGVPAVPEGVISVVVGGTADRYDYDSRERTLAELISAAPPPGRVRRATVAGPGVKP